MGGPEKGRFDMVSFSVGNLSHFIRVAPCTVGPYTVVPRTVRRCVLQWLVLLNILALQPSYRSNNEGILLSILSILSCCYRVDFEYVSNTSVLYQIFCCIICIEKVFHDCVSDNVVGHYRTMKYNHNRLLGICSSCHSFLYESSLSPAQS